MLLYIANRGGILELEELLSRQIVRIYGSVKLRGLQSLRYGHGYL